MDLYTLTQHVRLFLLGAIIVAVVRESVLLGRNRDEGFYAVVPVFGGVAAIFVLGRWLAHSDPTLGLREIGVRILLLSGFLAIGPLGLLCGRLAGELPFTRTFKWTLAVLFPAAIVLAFTLPFTFTGATAQSYGLVLPRGLLFILPFTALTVWIIIRWSRGSSVSSLIQTVRWNLAILSVALINDILNVLGVWSTFEALDIGLTASVFIAVGFNERSERARAELEGLRELMETRRIANARLATMSRHAGMAEVASNVLHNVGNSLNSVNISATMIGDAVRRSRLDDLAQVLDVMAQRDGDLVRFVQEDPRGAKSLELVKALVGELLNERRGVAQEVDGLLERVEHIKRVIAQQQRIAVGGGVREDVDLIAVIEEGLSHFGDALDRRGIEVVLDLAKLPPLKTDKHRLLQIIVNLVGNSRDAVVDEHAPRIDIRLDEVDGQAVIAVRDNGCGFSEDVAERVFEHGFTTKVDGHGFGLHSCALNAELLNGDLTAHSDGPGKGAVFSLALPVHEPDATDTEDGMEATNGAKASATASSATA